MRIGIDGGSWSNKRGYGRFLHEIVQALASGPHRHEFVMFLDQSAAREFPALPGFTVREVRLSESVAEGAQHDRNRGLMDLLRMSFAVARERLDVFWFPTVYSYFPILRQVPTVAGIHDTIADRNPQFSFTGLRQRLQWKTKVRAALFQADLVMTVSEYSRECLTDVHGLKRERIRVVPEAAASRFQPPDLESERERFILYVGGISPNKNLSTLIRAFAKLESGWRLKLVGAYQSDGFLGCYEEVRTLAGDGVEFLGFVPDEELVRLYQRASLFVLPSFDEGFGLPAIEAMASGTPVIVSEGNSLTEVVGEAGLTFPPDDEHALTHAMNRILSDENLWLRLSKAGVSRATEFSWSKAAAVLLDMFDEVSRQR